MQEDSGEGEFGGKYEEELYIPYRTMDEGYAGVVDW